MTRRKQGGPEADLKAVTEIGDKIEDALEDIDGAGKLWFGTSEGGLDEVVSGLFAIKRSCQRALILVEEYKERALKRMEYDA